MFKAQIGFYESVVAAPSQAAALRAWGVSQNLFAEGLAQICDVEAAREAALKHPEQPLRRSIGSKGAFRLEPRGRPVVVPAAGVRR